MVASLDGIIISQIYGDNSGGAVFDSDGDGTATQEDEFVSILNTSGAAVDISGWQIWSDSTGQGAPDLPQDGLYHTFPPGTVIQPGRQLFVINEITGTGQSNFQEASEGGVETGPGGVSSNLLTEGSPGNPESVALVIPDTGEFITINFDETQPSGIPALPGFPGTILVEETNAALESGLGDQNAGTSYQFNSATNTYVADDVFITCFAEGTLIDTPCGEIPVENLIANDMVWTLDHDAKPVRKVLTRHLRFDQGALDCHKPIQIKAGAFGSELPARDLIVSPQHRVLLTTADGGQHLASAKALVRLFPGVRKMTGRKRVSYYHLVFDRHEIVQTAGLWSESFFPGTWIRQTAPQRLMKEIDDIFAPGGTTAQPLPARSFIRSGKIQQMRPLSAYRRNQLPAALLV